MARTSNKREQILNFLTQFMNEHGYAPTVREICNAVGLQSTATVHYHLNALRDSVRCPSCTIACSTPRSG